MRIVIADDDDLAAEVLAHALTQGGHEILRAANGAEALEWIEENSVRLVISDWEMPVMTGLELCRQVRRRELSGYTYIILLTSRHSIDERVEGLQAGADDFIAKPFHPRELLARVQAGERVLSLETRDVAIFALARLAESRDPETGAHLERVQHYSRLLAQRLAAVPRFHHAIDAEFIRLIFLTSPLHDIGKVGIPDSVLLKPGPLTEREYAIMKEHAEIGAKTLEAALVRFPEARFLQMARDIAACHHEWFDGNGYPAGLAGDTIPLAARIVALADVYDALTSKRVYKEGFTHHVARSIIVEGAGTHFDPDIVQAFIDLEDEFVAVGKRFQNAPERERAVAV